ncbi:MAG: type II toxin-antitoxin system VapC family toxin [Deltaproteobacteria bacterium]|jgi:tRNA(fMet)-specific endonuclease VapC|nr:type II toxin-antitoxin system VapC family toxin [Deltaproteobacteria bacterium]MBW2530801.1 type II toxin-antitoxin system VapC family toxin [Deltaproteobacteria bacterium]
MYLLDTNVCIRLLNDSSPQVAKRFAAESPSTMRLCSVVKAELLYGARKSHRVDKVLHTLRRFFDPLSSLPFDDDAAEEYGRIRADLEVAGTPIGGHDLLIAAIARRHDATVVTHNTDEFSRVAGLRVEDWEA